MKSPELCFSLSKLLRGRFKYFYTGVYHFKDEIHSSKLNKKTILARTREQLERH